MTNMHVSRMNRNVGESQPRCGSIRGVALVALALWGYANTLLARRLGRGRCGSCSVSCFGYSRTCNGPLRASLLSVACVGWKRPAMHATGVLVVTKLTVEHTACAVGQWECWRSCR
jgi:hypothetical protein